MNGEEIAKFIKSPRPEPDNKFWRIEAENGVQFYDELHLGIEEVWDDAQELESKGYEITKIQQDH